LLSYETPAAYLRAVAGQREQRRNDSRQIATARAGEKEAPELRRFRVKFRGINCRGDRI
jgi:hypothetical protein